ncbi:hypothetical protein MITS9509_01576 [Synechococcus sp. MIT S9509]|uniref:hypothetical protein n=1 Tax=Synechococcus sp. MIT S9509 TaxID=1801630 RepID=UPI0007BB287C|nr:hypothetical protein [Synechococcus sp. MIT S9509]KZR92118.1 hypothetical protein MITS9509_01576 [Synechococcus sp. MIT S9509]
MLKVTHRGEIVQLQVTSWEVPDSIPIDGRKAWIESQHREAQLPSAAEAERQRRKRELLNARIQQQQTQDTIGQLQADVEQVNAGLAELSERFGTSPDVTAMTEWNAASSAIYARSMLLSEEVAGMQATVSDLLERTTAMAEATKTGEQLQKQSLALLKNNQEQINGSFETYRRALADLQAQTNDTSRSVGALNTAAQDNRELIATAANISEEAINIAGLQAKKAVDEGMEDMLAILSLALEVMSINEKALALQLNTDEFAPNRGVFLTREYLRRVKDIHSGKGNARDADIEGPLL